MKKALGNEYSWFLMSQIAAFLKLVQVPIQSNFLQCFQNTFGSNAELVGSICHEFLSPLFATQKINVNTNRIEGRWATIRRHDANKGGISLFSQISNKCGFTFRSHCISLQGFPCCRRMEIQLPPLQQIRAFFCVTHVTYNKNLCQLKYFKLFTSCSRNCCRSKISADVGSWNDEISRETTIQK